MSREYEAPDERRGTDKDDDGPCLPAADAARFWALQAGLKTRASVKTGYTCEFGQTITPDGKCPKCNADRRGYCREAVARDYAELARLREEVPRLVQELRLIAGAEPRTWGDHSSDFQPWAQNRARHAFELLREARDLLARAGAVRTVARVRLALSSAEGAVRHASGKTSRAEWRQRQAEAAQS